MKTEDKITAYHCRPCCQNDAVLLLITNKRLDSYQTGSSINESHNRCWNSWVVGSIVAVNHVLDKTKEQTDCANVFMNGKDTKWGTAVSVKACWSLMCESVRFGKEPSAGGDEGCLDKFSSYTVFWHQGKKCKLPSKQETFSDEPILGLIVLRDAVPKGVSMERRKTMSSSEKRERNESFVRGNDPPLNTPIPLLHSSHSKSFSQSF